MAIGEVIDLQPGEQEIAKFRPWPRIGEHPLGLADDLVVGGELARGRGTEQLLVGQRIPKAKRWGRVRPVAVNGKYIRRCPSYQAIAARRMLTR